MRFFLLFRRKFSFWHHFVTPFSTFANMKGSLPTNSTTPDRLRYVAGAIVRCRLSRVLANFNLNLFFEHRQKKVFFCARYLVLIYTPKEVHSRIFVIGGSFFARQMLAKKSFSRGGQLVLGHPPGPVIVCTVHTSTSWPPQEYVFFLAQICHAITDPPVTKIRLWASFGV